MNSRFVKTAPVSGDQSAREAPERRQGHRDQKTKADDIEREIASAYVVSKYDREVADKRKMPSHCKGECESKDSTIRQDPASGPARPQGRQRRCRKGHEEWQGTEYRMEDYRLGVVGGVKIRRRQYDTIRNADRDAQHR